jgi:hypothetical protein
MSNVTVLHVLYCAFNSELFMHLLLMITDPTSHLPPYLLLYENSAEQLFFYSVEDSKTSRNMCEDLLGYSHKQAKY